MAYRSEIDALQARLTTLEADLGERTRERDEVAHMLAEARARAQREDYEAAAPIRRRRWRIAIAAAVSLLALGIGIAALVMTRPTPHNRMDQAIARIDQFGNETCQCGDCAQKVSEAMTKWD